MGNDNKLNTMQREFVRQYCLHRNATKAAVLAGYSKGTARQQGSKLLSHPDIRAAIENNEIKVQKKFEIKQEDILQALFAIAFFDPMEVLEWDEKSRLVFKKDVPKEYLKGADFTIYPEYQSKADQRDGVLRAKLTMSSGDRKGALEALGRHIGLWKDKDGSGDDKESRTDVLKRVHELYRKHTGRGSGDGNTGS